MIGQKVRWRVPRTHLLNFVYDLCKTEKEYIKPETIINYMRSIQHGFRGTWDVIIKGADKISLSMWKRRIDVGVE